MIHASLYRIFEMLLNKLKVFKMSLTKTILSFLASSNWLSSICWTTKPFRCSPVSVSLGTINVNLTPSTVWVSGFWTTGAILGPSSCSWSIWAKKNGSFWAFSSFVGYSRAISVRPFVALCRDRTSLELYVAADDSQ